MIRFTAILISAILMLAFTACGMLNKPQVKPDVEIPPPTASQPLSQPEYSAQLTHMLNQFSGENGLYAKNIKTSQTFQFNQDSIFPTASTHKLLVALAVYKYLYSDALIEDKKRFDNNIKQMIVVSDNPAFYELLNDIEHKKPDALTRVLSDLNLVNTRIHSREAFQKYGYHSVTTPYEMAVVFETIYNEVYLGKEFSDILKDELSNTIFQQEIPRHRKGVKVLHKVGELPGVQCDVGIIDDGHDLILISAYTITKRPPPYASDFIADISDKAYNSLRTANISIPQ